MRNKLCLEFAIDKRWARIKSQYNSILNKLWIIVYAIFDNPNYSRIISGFYLIVLLILDYLLVVSFSSIDASSNV